MCLNMGLDAQHLIEVGVFKYCDQATIILEDPDFKQRLIIQQSADCRGRPGSLATSLFTSHSYSRSFRALAEFVDDGWHPPTLLMFAVWCICECSPDHYACCWKVKKDWAIP